MSPRPHFLEPLLRSGIAAPQLVNERTGAIIASDIELAVDSQSRNRGLLGRSGIADGSVMIIAPCNAIHTFFMRFAIDLVFVDRGGRVMKIYRNVRPWRARVAFGGFAALEMAAGSIDRVGLDVGDSILAKSAT